MMMKFYLTVERPRKPGHNLLLGFHGKLQGIFLLTLFVFAYFSIIMRRTLRRASGCFGMRIL
jgi:hypothetical protein